jgi:hypothetical protein
MMKVAKHFSTPLNKLQKAVSSIDMKKEAEQYMNSFKAQILYLQIVVNFLFAFFLFTFICGSFNHVVNSPDCTVSNDWTIVNTFFGKNVDVVVT